MCDAGGGSKTWKNLIECGRPAGGTGPAAWRCSVRGVGAPRSQSPKHQSKKYSSSYIAIMSRSCAEKRGNRELGPFQSQPTSPRWGSLRETALAKLFHQRRLTPSCGWQAPTAERTVGQARIIAESLTPKPGIREHIYTEARSANVCFDAACRGTPDIPHTSRNRRC